MKVCIVPRPTLLEVGESCVLTPELPAKPIDVQCDRSVVEVEGNRMIGLKAGQTEVRVAIGEKTWSWTVNVIEAVAPRFSIQVFEKPCMIFSPSELVKFRENIQSTPRTHHHSTIDFGALWHTFLAKANGYVKETHFEVRYPSVSHVMEVKLPLVEPDVIPNPEGYVDYPFWTMFSRAVEERLITLSAVYLVTGDVKYAEKAKGHLLGLAKFAKWYEFDHRGAEGNLSNAHFVIGAASAYDAIRSMLSQAERAQLAEALLCKGLQPLAIDFGNTDMHNIVAAKQVAMMYGAAALRSDSPFANKYMNEAYAYISSYLDRRLESAETEGLLYDNVAAKHVWMAADLYRRVTGDDTLCSHAYLQSELPDRYFRMLSPGTPNTFPNFSDSFYKLDLSFMMAMLTTHHAHPAAMWYLNRFEGTNATALMNVRQLPQEQSPGEYYGGNGSAVFERIGWAGLRSGWGDSDHLLSFVSSASSRDHNHKDQNNFMLNVGGEWLLTNPGYQDYKPGPKADYTVGTVGHNALLINGQGQPLRGGGAITANWIHPLLEAVSGDATASYDGLLKRWVRTVLHVDQSYYVIWDQVAASDNKDTVELLFHTTSKVLETGAERKPGDRLQGREAMFQGERHSVRLTSALPLQSELTVHEYAGAESYGPHLSVADKSDAVHKAFVTLLQPSTFGSELKVIERNSTADGHARLTVKRSFGYDLLLLGALADDAGYTFAGAAAWASYRSDAEGEGNRLQKLAVWDGTLWTAPNGLSFQAELPLSWTVDLHANSVTVHNRHSHPVTLSMVLPGGGREVWSIASGKNERALGHDRNEVHQ